MDDTEITWEILNAYVDGELDRVMSARVAAAAANDASLGARIATLSKLKASTAGSELPPSQIPPLPIQLRRNRRVTWHYAVAAGLALVIAVGLWASPFFGSKPDQSWLESALSAQRDWIESASSRETGNLFNVTIGATKAMRPLDLSDAELKLVYAASVPWRAGNGATFLGYRGPHGCMVGLWIGSPQDGLGREPRVFESKDMRVRAWRDHNTGYALIAKGMDPHRLDRLSEVVVRLVDPGQNIDDSIRIALRDVTRTGTACRV